MNEPKSLDQALAEAFSKADHLQAPLDKRLKLYLGESRKLLPEMEATYDQLVARISNNIGTARLRSSSGSLSPITSDPGASLVLTLTHHGLRYQGDRCRAHRATLGRVRVVAYVCAASPGSDQGGS